MKICAGHGACADFYFKICWIIFIFLEDHFKCDLYASMYFFEITENSFDV